MKKRQIVPVAGSSNANQFRRAAAARFVFV
jgi:hypothetical protein